MVLGGCIKTVKNPDTTLQITIPPETKKSLRMLSAKSGETMRIIVLKGLVAVGVKVPSGEILDRRKPK
jgi:hypothetical protein